MSRYPRTNIVRHNRIVSAALATATIGVLIVAVVVWVPARARAAESPVGLGTAASYVVLGGQTVTNTGPSVLHGDLGVSPGSANTGFPPGIVLGATHAGDAAAGQAQSDLTIAYDNAAGRAPTASKAGDLVGQTLPGGVYKSTGPLALSGTLTLDGQHNPDSVFIFQIASTLITASASRVSLVNGAQACHVFWQVGSSATLGTHSSFTGTILALTSITVTTGTVIHGRALARNGAVTLDDNTITRPTCITTPPPTTTTTTTTSPPTTTTTPPTTTPPPTTTTPPSTTTTTTPPPTTTTTTTGPPTTTPPTTTTGPTTGPSTTATTTGPPTTTTTGPMTTTGLTPTTTSTSTAGIGPSGTVGSGGGSGFPGQPGGQKPLPPPASLAYTGVSSVTGGLIAAGVLLMVLGVLLYFLGRSRRTANASRRRS